ncbi:MAG: gamma-glutamyl-gamma-aminobutyrate hydrolase family protein [Oscillospiraceae bacterium]|nr:gamma-glutamyl-gamma-aminobutyrate hydrolase family protein [Oscillospiraceae bacterium]
MNQNMTKTDLLKNVPSWHHQAVRDVAGTRLVVTAATDTCGIDIIEAVERPDKTFVLGLQFHPEIAVIQQRDEDFLVFFTTLAEEASRYDNTRNDLDLAA